MMCAYQEPTLLEVMAEPIVQALMARDSVREADLRRLLADVRLMLEQDAARAQDRRPREDWVREDRA
ncbi:MAG TPA: hypothetical protein VNT30_25475 [Stellaceae bacterium]|nr:hypothetical protein [Stellaceae bacterium]